MIRDDKILFFARQHGINKDVFCNWIIHHKRDGLDRLEETKKNNHYSKAHKLMVIHAYLNGEDSFEELANRFSFRNSTQTQNWINKYNSDKTVMASPSRKQVLTMSCKTIFDERISIVEYVTKDKHSFTEVAEHFQVLGFNNLLNRFEVERSTSCPGTPHDNHPNGTLVEWV